MPPAKRARLSSRSSNTVTDTRSSNRGWLSVLRRRKPAIKRPRPAGGNDDDGTQLTDETLLLIFSVLPEIADLVRCAATCRRWRRLVSGDAAFICRTPTTKRLGGRFPGTLGFFHHDEDAATPPRFVFTASAARRFGLQQPPPLNSLVDDEHLFDSSRVVASRNGVVVVDLGRRGKHDRALKLCVCNPMTGDVHVLPRLTGKDGLGQYACTVITAQDLTRSEEPQAPSNHFRLVMVYSRRNFTAFRSYSSDTGSWSEEAKVTGAQLGKKQMTSMRTSVVDRGANAVYWLAKGEQDMRRRLWTNTALGIVFGLRLDTLEAAMTKFVIFDMDKTSLGLTPEGRLCTVELDRGWRQNTGTGKLEFKLNFRVCGHRGLDGNDNDFDILRMDLRMDKPFQWECEKEIWVDGISLDDDLGMFKPRWFCEKSRVVFFTAYRFGNRMSEVYAFSLDTKTLQKVASLDWKGDPWGKNLHGYEMSQVAYLASLAEPQGMDDT